MERGCFNSAVLSASQARVAVGRLRVVFLSQLVLLICVASQLNLLEPILFEMGITEIPLTHWTA